MPKTFKEWLMLVISLVLTQSAGIAGSIFTSMSLATWYVFLERPEFAPPQWVFGPVWIFLYALMGFALFLVWRRGNWLNDVRYGVRLFIVQLGLNVLWSVLFFGLQNPLYGLACLGAIILVSMATTYFFYRVSKTAGLLMVPYLMWLVFAFILNYAIWILN